MKKFNLSLVAVLAMSTFAVAGGDIAPVEEPVVVVPEVLAVDASAFYLGLAYGLQDNKLVVSDKLGLDGDNILVDHTQNSVMLQAGYKFNDYVAVEGRYWFGMDETFNFDGRTVDIATDSFGIYVKPMYPVTDAFDIYALLGYGSSEHAYSEKFANHAYLDGTTDTLNGFSWGLGGAYSFTDNVAVFVDYVSLYDDKEGLDARYEADYTISTWNFGVTYQF